jgi:hypothetical protein
VLESRRNAGDRVQLSFFDTKVLVRREIPFLPDNTSLPFSLARVSNTDPNYVAIRNILHNPPDAAGLVERISRRAIFPRVDPLISPAVRTDYNVDPPVYAQDQVGGVFTNIHLAASRAANSLFRNGSVYARRNVVMFSDFIANCSLDGWCSNDGKTAGDMILGVWFQTIGRNYPGKIAFNPIITGDYVQPHTTLPLSGTGTGCLWDPNKIRMLVPGPINENGNANMDGYVNNYGWGCPGATCDDFDANPPDSHYYYPNYMYGAARDTGGEWGVIRPCCMHNGACTDVRSILDTGCTQLEPELLNNTFESGYGCKKNAAGTHCVPGFAFSKNWIDDPDNSGHPIPYLDQQGRLICDPQGRTPAKQMADYMTTIMGSNSIVLVESNRITQ